MPLGIRSAYCHCFYCFPVAGKHCANIEKCIYTLDILITVHYEGNRTFREHVKLTPRLLKDLLEIGGVMQ